MSVSGMSSRKPSAGVQSATWAPVRRKAVGAVSTLGQSVDIGGAPTSGAANGLAEFPLYRQRSSGEP